MHELQDTDLIRTLSLRIKADLKLIEGLLDQERRSAGRPLRLCALVRAVTLGTEALFIDASTTRVDLIRHVRSVAAAVESYCGVRIEWTGDDHPVLCDAGRAALAGLAAADLCRLYPVSRLTASRRGKGRFSIHIVPDADATPSESDKAFPRRIVDEFLRGDFKELNGGVEIEFALSPDSAQSALPEATSSFTSGRMI